MSSTRGDWEVVDVTMRTTKKRCGLWQGMTTVWRQ